MQSNNATHYHLPGSIWSNLRINIRFYVTGKASISSHLIGALSAVLILSRQRIARGNGPATYWLTRRFPLNPALMFL
jgi:hypothetical protein